MPDSSVCLSARGLFEEIRSIKQQFDLAYSAAIASEQSADIKRAQELKQAFTLKVAQIEKILVIRKLILCEQASNKRFFGEAYEHVPPPPKEATLERISEWKEQGFELKYIPAICLIDIEEDPPGVITQVKARDDIPNWKKKPTGFFDRIQSKNLTKAAGNLPGGWILVDTRPKPNYDNGTQMYEHDPLAPALAELNRKGIITQMSYNGGTALSRESRFGLSPNELAKPEVRQAFADVLHLDPSQLSLQSALIFNILGNRDYPEWGETDTSEWFGDTYGVGVGSRRLFGGSSGVGGLSVVNSCDLGLRSVSIGFRLLGRFSS